MLSQLPSLRRRPTAAPLLLALLWAARAEPQQPPQAPEDAPPAAPAEAPPAEPSKPEPSASPPPSPDAVFSGRPVPSTDQEEQEEHAWFDAGHEFMGRLFFAPVARLDRFFADQTAIEPEPARSFARARYGLFLAEDGTVIRTADLIVNVRLPILEQRLDRFRLVLTSAINELQEELTSGTGASAPGLPRGAAPTDLELRIDALRGTRSYVDLGTGILVGWPPGAFVRARHRLAVPIADLLAARIATQAFWRTDMHLGMRIDWALDWPATPSSVVRLSGNSQVAQRETNGLEYAGGLVYMKAFSPSAAVALGLDGHGATHSPVALDKYRVFARLRHAVLRRWLYFELEPELGWPWTLARGRTRVLAVTVRLEVQFEGAEPSAAPAPEHAPGP